MCTPVYPSSTNSAHSYPIQEDPTSDDAPLSITALRTLFDTVTHRNMQAGFIFWHFSNIINHLYNQEPDLCGCYQKSNDIRFGSLIVSMIVINFVRNAIGSTRSNQTTQSAAATISGTTAGTKKRPRRLAQADTTDQNERPPKYTLPEEDRGNTSGITSTVTDKIEIVKKGDYATYTHSRSSLVTTLCVSGEEKGTLFFTNGPSAAFPPQASEQDITAEIVEYENCTVYLHPDSNIATIQLVDNQKKFIEVYIGEASYDLPHGQGILIRQGGSCEGIFHTGVPHGEVKMQWGKDDYYHGPCENGSFSGQGILRREGVGVIKGFFQNGEMYGEADITRGKTNYRGKVNSLGIPHGYGTAEYADGVVYKGQFQHGYRHGNGTLDFPAKPGQPGETIKGEFIKGKIRQGTLTTTDGKTYQGPFRGWLPHGKGKARDGQANVYNEFSDGKPLGYSKLLFGGRARNFDSKPDTQLFHAVYPIPSFNLDELV